MSWQNDGGLLRRPPLGARERINSLFPVMNLVFVLSITVVSRSRAHIWKRLALDLDEAHELVLGDDAVAVVVDQTKNVADYLVSPGLGNALVGVIHQAICAENLESFPCAVGIEVVQSEEGGGVEVLDVVFLWKEARAMLVAVGP